MSYLTTPIFPRAITKPVTETMFWIPLGSGFVLRSKETVEKIEGLKNFFAACKGGRVQGFRFKDSK